MILSRSAGGVSTERQITWCNGTARSKQSDAAASPIILSDTFRLGVVADQARPVRQALDFEVVSVEHHFQARQGRRPDENELTMGILIPDSVSRNHREIGRAS